MDGEERNRVFTGRRQLELIKCVLKSCSVSFMKSNGHGKALLGFERNITLLDGRDLLLDRKGVVTQPGKMRLLYSWFLLWIRYTTPPLGFIQTFKGEGMPHFGSRSSRGDLFVEYNVVLPLEVSPETRRSKSFYSFAVSTPCPASNSQSLSGVP